MRERASGEDPKIMAQPRLTVGLLLSRSWAGMRAHGLMLAALVAGFVVVQQLCSWGVDQLLQEQGRMMQTARLQLPDLVDQLANPRRSSQLPSPQSLGIDPGLWLQILGLTLVETLLLLLASICAITWLTSRMAGFGTSLQAALLLSAKRAVLVVLMAVLYAVGTVLGLMAFLIPGLLVGTLWSLAVPVMMMERAGPMTALNRSWALVRPHFGVTALFLAMVTFISGLAGFLLSVPAAVSPWLAVPIGVIGSMFSVIWLSSCLSTLYLSVTGRWPEDAPS